MELGGLYRPPDLRDLKTDAESTRREPLLAPAEGGTSADYAGLCAQLFFERQVWRSVRLGASGGFVASPGGRSTLRYTGVTPLDSTQRVELRGVEIPISVYFKALGPGAGFFLGGGVTRLRSQAAVTLDGPAGSVSGVFESRRQSPHALAGFELFLTESLAVNLGVRWVLKAVMDDFAAPLTSGGTPGNYYLVMEQLPSGEMLAMAHESARNSPGLRAYRQDLSGPRATLSLRWYFGGGVD